MITNSPGKIDVKTSDSPSSRSFNFQPGMKEQKSHFSNLAFGIFPNDVIDDANSKDWNVRSENHN